MGSEEAEQARWVTQLGGDPQALLHVPDAHVPAPEAALAQITTPCSWPSATRTTDTPPPRSLHPPADPAAEDWVAVKALAVLAWRFVPR